MNPPRRCAALGIGDAVLRASVLLPAALALGCGASDESVASTQGSIRALDAVGGASNAGGGSDAARTSNAAGTGSVGSVCNNLAISAPPAVDLDQSFTATAMRRLPGKQGWAAAGPDSAYAWEGDGLAITVAGGAASVACTWSGEHALDVTRLADGCKASARVRCEPPLCKSVSGPCPGVLTRGTELPRTNTLVRIREPSAAPPGQEDTSARCPAEVGSWIGEPLLRVRDANEVSVFCSYSWVAPPGTTPNADMLAQTLGGDVQWDDPTVAAHAEYTEFREKLAAQSRAQVGAVSWPATPAAAPVRIAVVDTAASLWSDPDNNPHGKAVGMLALDTACKDSPDCRVTAENFLGLPLYRDSSTSPAVIRRDVRHGGGFGAPGQLAAAIRRAVDAASPNTRTVLNLSVAYDTDALQDGLYVRAADYSNRVVLDALHYANCRGALIIAAAGNGPVPALADQLPGLPARWTALHGLPASECQSRFGIPNPRPGNGTKPLLYAVSGLTFGGHPLLSTRGAGQSVLAAVALTAVRKQPDGAYTLTLSGSSMGTGVVSGVAAALWSHAPTLAPDEVITQLYATSEPVAAPPDFFPYAASGQPSAFSDVRRITLCSAATAGYATCVQEPVPATAVAPDTLPDVPDGSRAEIGTVAQSLPPGVSAWQFPWLRPQPAGSPGCGPCGASPGNPGLLSIDFRNAFALNAVTSMRVRISVPITATLARQMRADTLGGSFALVETAIPDPILDPFTVSLTGDTSGATDAELTYQLQVDGVTVDANESVLIE